jgi:hypothetical protein
MDAKHTRNDAYALSDEQSDIERESQELTERGMSGTIPGNESVKTQE